MKISEIEEFDIKPISGTDSYFVSCDGIVYSAWSKYGHYRTGELRGIRMGIDKCGYMRVALFRDGKGRSTLVHRLVANAFIDNPKNSPQVNHKDGVKTNNYYKNLEWCTNQENVIHAYKNGMINVSKAEGRYNSKFKNRDIPIIRDRYATGCYTMQEIANDYGCTKQAIYLIVKRKNWKSVT